MKIVIVSTEVIFKSPKDKLKIMQANKINHNNEENLYNKYNKHKRNLEFLSNQNNNAGNNHTITQKEYKAKKISQVESKRCNRKNCNFPYGECVDDKICKCLEPYANLDFLVDNEETKNKSVNLNITALFCRYKRKSQLTAFALEAVFMAGIGHLYLNRLLYGGVKFSLFFILGLTYYLGKRKNLDVKFFTIEHNQNFKITFLNIFLVLLVTGLLALQIYDMAMFGTNSFTDAFGIPLISWNKGIRDLILFDYKEQNFLDI
jgi:hypothetical protein